MEKTLEQQPSDCLKIVLFGPESTGKTTLATQLSEHYNCPLVPEYMRIYLQKKWDEQGLKVEKNDLLPIAKGQMELENKAATHADDLLICDTNLLEIKVYSEYYYGGFCPEPIIRSLNHSEYDLYLLTYIDTPWVADDLRDRPDDRLYIFRTFEDELKRNALPHGVIRGSESQRLTLAIELIDKLRRR